MRQGPRPSIVALALLLVAASAAPARADPAPSGGGDAAPRGLWMNFKLGASLSGSFWSAPVPRFLVGYHLGRVAVGVEVSVSGGRTWVGGSGSLGPTSDRDLQVAVVPTVEVVLARRGRLALALQTGLGGGYGRSWSSDTEFRSAGGYGVVQASLGARYHLHRRFALGVELGAAALLGRSEWTFEGDRTEYTWVRANPWAALGATVIW